MRTYMVLVRGVHARAAAALLARDTGLKAASATASHWLGQRAGLATARGAAPRGFSAAWVPSTQLCGSPVPRSSASVSRGLHFHLPGAPGPAIGAVRHNSSSSSHFATSRLIDFSLSLDKAAESLNKCARDVQCGPSKLWRKRHRDSTARAAYLPFYVFDIEVDVYFKGILAGRQGTTDEYVFKRVRYHSDGSGPDAVDMLVYGSFEYRREYAHAVKRVNLAYADPLHVALASPGLGRLASHYPPTADRAVDERPDLDPFQLSQSFAFDMIKERILKHCKAMTFQHFNKTLGDGKVVDTRVALKVRRKQCTPLFLPAYVFEYRYLGLPYRALVSGVSGEVGMETHISPFKFAGLTSLMLLFGLERAALEILVPAVGVSMVVVALQPAVMKMYRGFQRAMESRADQQARSRKDWYDWEKSGQWGQWFEAKWTAREREHQRKEYEHERQHDRRHTHSSSKPRAGDSESLYAVLGLQGQEAVATTDDIKRAFRRLALQHHPDAVRSKPEYEQRAAHEKFVRILEAYKVLRNKDRRAQYDKTGAA